jgi:2-keto-3-deoxy-L-rhamnonate aldolase RhmA
MRPHDLRQKFDSGEPTLGTRVFLPDPAVAEAVGQAGIYDYMEFVAEYNAFTLHDLDNICRAAELHGLGTLIKLDYEQNRYLSQRAIGSGFGGVLFADMRTAEDVRYAVRSVRPDSPEHGGTYGAAARRNIRPEYGGGEAYLVAIASTVVGIMVEKRETFDDIDSVLSVEGVDFVQWGPTDYAMSSGMTAAEALRVRETLLDACERHGVPARIELTSLDEFSEFVARGIRHFSLGMDIDMLYQGWRRLGTEARLLLTEAAERAPHDQMQAVTHG